MKKEREPNYTAVAKIAHAGITRQGYNERTGVVRFQRPRPALTVDPATRFWWLSDENGLVCVITCKAAMSALTARGRVGFGCRFIMPSYSVF
ncbi:hypothetical protein [Mucilaginibacter gracilis]|uniref:hypothetical protein n=1 Tax=Mucilaginibacter gracilis TaxID=423350 RepID=UPI0011C35B86|nr:hypothetical protein [Mucilaginibacter gracilis]